jgi:ribosomal RNA assembly protein
VVDCMKNVHPVYHLKRLMIQKELEQDPKLADQDWTRFLPHFKSKNVPRRKTATTTRKKTSYTPFPPPQLPSKVDLQLDTGEYFVSERERKERKLADKRSGSEQRSVENRKTKLATEAAAPVRKRQKKDGDKKKKGLPGEDEDDGVEERIKKLQQQMQKRSEQNSLAGGGSGAAVSSNNSNLSDFVQGAKKSR